MQSFSSTWGLGEVCTGDAWNLPSEATGVGSFRLLSSAEGTGALALTHFNQLHDCWRAWTDTHAIHIVRTKTTTTTTLRSHFGSSHPRRGWLEFRSHGGSSPSAQLFIHCLHSVLSSQHVGHSLACCPGCLLFLVRSFAVSGPYLERVGAR